MSITLPFKAADEPAQTTVRQTFTSISIKLNNLYVVLFIIGYIGFFSARLYPRIPALLGGGAPTRVRFVMKAPPNDVVKLQSGRTTIVYPLLLESEKTIVVLNGDRAISFSHDLVDAVIAEP